MRVLVQNLYEEQWSPRTAPPDWENSGEITQRDSGHGDTMNSSGLPSSLGLPFFIFLFVYCTSPPGTLQ